jgi:hypothetical protein
MTLSELFAAIGDDNLKFGIVASLLVGNQTAPTKKFRYSKITLATDEDFTSIINGNRVGFLVFCDKEKLEAARKNAPPTPSESPAVEQPEVASLPDRGSTE